MKYNTRKEDFRNIIIGLTEAIIWVDQNKQLIKERAKQIKKEKKEQ